MFGPMSYALGASSDTAACKGLCYKLDETLTGNTMDAHRLLLMAATIDKQAELLEAMFHGYFEQGKPLFMPEDLLAITDEVGINRAAA